MQPLILPGLATPFRHDFVMKIAGLPCRTLVRVGPEAAAVAKRVSVFVCGVQKGGTTSLFSYLRDHPGLSAPHGKEVHFFDDETQDWNAPDYGGLEAAFDDDGGRLRFEATPIYGFWPPAMARLKAYNPAARLIFLFRDPFERAWSHWCMEYARGEEGMSFAEAIRGGRMRMRLGEPLSRVHRHLSYVERGFYAVQVRRALAHFPAEQLLFLRSEDLANQPHATLARIAHFLGIGPFPPLPPRREFTRPDILWPCRPTPADRALFTRLLKLEILAFSELTGLDVSRWPTMREVPALERRWSISECARIPFIALQDQASGKRYRTNSSAGANES
ncbi:sulfotransferase [Xanthobacter sp. DSM 24535]|uniref:sulfotransferase n=1 Tax=Roseixanthobacter psychrophilus TaxID=3119917 RepID=UPI0037275A59